MSSHSHIARQQELFMLTSDKTVRMRTLSGEPRPHDVDAKTVRVRPVAAPAKPADPAPAAKPVQRAISGYDDSKTVRHRVVDIAVKPLPSAIADRIPRTVSSKPSMWAIA